VTEPAVAPTRLTAQVPEDRAHALAPRRPSAVSVVRLTVPEELPVTDTVHVVESPTATEIGEHATVTVIAGEALTVTPKAIEEPARFLESPE
jgi:hypothetical protein